MEAARRALELDSTLVIPHVTLGHALWEHELDVEGGRREFEIALRLDPDDPDANIFYGWFLIVNGRPSEGRSISGQSLGGVPPGAVPPSS